MLRRLCVVGAACATLLVACGDETTSSSPEATEDASSATPTEPSTPATGEPSCDEVWVDGADLPDPYRGCYDAAGLVKPERLACSSGQTIVTYADRFYAVPGNRVNDEVALDTSAAFDRVEKQCGA